MPTAFTTLGAWSLLLGVGSAPPASRCRPRDRPAAAARRGYCAGLMVGKSPCRLTTISASPARIERLQRLVDPVRAGGVVGRASSPPRRHGRSPPPRSPGCRWRPRPGQFPLPRARRSTWTIIGKPAMSISGLPGRRVEAMRAGISTRVRVSVMRFGAVSGREMVGTGSRSAPIYGLPEHGQTDISAWLGGAARKPDSWGSFAAVLRPFSRSF